MISATCWIAREHVTLAMLNRRFMQRIVAIEASGAILQVLIVHDASFVAISEILALHHLLEVRLHFDWLSLVQRRDYETIFIILVPNGNP